MIQSSACALTYPHAHVPVRMSDLKNIVIIGGEFIPPLGPFFPTTSNPCHVSMQGRPIQLISTASVAGHSLANYLAPHLPTTHRILLIDANEFAYWAIGALRAAVVPGTWRLVPPVPEMLTTGLQAGKNGSPSLSLLPMSLHRGPSTE